MSLLLIEDLPVAYGQIEALKGVSLPVEKGEVVAILGANGAGKTTLMRAISGLLAKRGGRCVRRTRTYSRPAPTASCAKASRSRRKADGSSAR